MPIQTKMNTIFFNSIFSEIIIFYYNCNNNVILDVYKYMDIIFDNIKLDGKYDCHLSLSVILFILIIVKTTIQH